MDQLTLQSNLPQNSAQKCLKRGKCLINNDSRFKQNHFSGNLFSISMVTVLFIGLLLMGWTAPAFSQVAKNYQHWADAGVPNWNGDVLNDSKSDYFEGQVIPHVHVMQGSTKKALVFGQEYSFVIKYNFYQDTKNAGGFSHVTTYNRSRNPGLLPGGSGSNPLPDNALNDGVMTGIQGKFYSVNADIVSATGPVKSGSGTFDNIVTVTFRYTGTSATGLVEIYYGLYIAEPGQVPEQGKGPTNGASSWSGGSLQTTVNSDFSGALSIQLAPAAIIRGEISGLKYSDANNNGSRQTTTEGTLAGWTFYLDLNNNGVLNTGEPTDLTGTDGIFSFSVTPDADKSDPDNDPYFVRELQQTGSGYSQTQPIDANPNDGLSAAYGPILITTTDPNETGILFGNFRCNNPVASINSQTNVNCFGGATGSATATATGGGGGYSYSWNTPSPQTTATATGLVAGTYTVTVTDVNGCSDTEQVTITGPAAALVASIGSPTNVRCFGTATGSATASATGGTPGTAGYSYSWNTTPVQTTATATGLSVGSYTVTVTDANGCTDTEQVTITGPAAALVASIGNPTNVGCFGDATGSATATANGGTPGTAGYSYSWNTTPVQTTARATNLRAGSYTVTVTDANGCTDTELVTISQPAAALVASIGNPTNVGCFGDATGSATASANGGTPGTAGYSYSWNTIPVQTTARATNLRAGSYTVTVTDANGCTDTEQVTITQPSAALAASIGTPTNVNCFGDATGSATATANGGTPGTAGYSYSWNTLPVQTTARASGLSAGTYTVTVTDANGCTDTEQVTITQPAAPLSATATATTECTNGLVTVSLSIVPSGGTAPYTITSVPTGIQGSYSYTVTDANGCSCPVTSSLRQETTLNSKLSSPAIISSTTALKPELVAKSVSAEVNKLTLTAYPNPFTDQVNFIFRSPESGYAKLEIFDLMGKSMGVVYKGNVEAAAQQKAEFSVPAYSSRTMLVYRLTVGKQVVSGKVLPQ